MVTRIAGGDNGERGALATLRRQELQDSVAFAYDRLVRPNWAPWFPFSEVMFRRIAETCPEGQLVLKAEERIEVEGKNPILKGTPIAMLNLNRVNFDGDASHLPTWGQMFGSAAAFRQSYAPEGNAFVMLNINVDSDVRGQRLPERLIAAAKEAARKNGVASIVGLFRPDGYGASKRIAFDRGVRQDPFDVYISRRRDDGELQDDWLRNLERNGMRMLTPAISRDTMVIRVPLSTFREYQASYRPQFWYQTGTGIWECGGWTDGAGRIRGENISWHIVQPNGDRKEYFAIGKESRVAGSV